MERTEPLDAMPEAPADAVARDAAYVLARSLPRANLTARRAALRSVDPLRRAAVARRVEAALDDARHATGHPDEAHRTRLALLDLLGRDVPATECADVAAVEARVADAAVPASAVRWTRSLAAVVAACLCAASVGLYLALRPVPFAGLRPASPPRAAATRDGGVPLSHEMLRAALAQSLPALGAEALDAGLEGRDPSAVLGQRRAALLDGALHESLPRPVGAALRRLADDYPRYVAREVTAVDVMARAVAFDRALVDAGLAYRVEPRQVSGVVQLLTYEVIEVRRVGPTRAVHARRLDRLNLLESRFGHALEGGDVLVPLDRIEETVVSRIAPLLEAPPFPALLPQGVSPALYPYVGEAEAALARPLRASLPTRCGPAVHGLLAALAARRTAFAQWAQMLGAQGISLTPPRGYRMDLELVTRVGARNPRLRDLERAHARLGEPENVRAFVCVRDLVADDFVRGVVHERTPPADVGSSIRGVLDPLGERPRESLVTDPSVRAMRRHLGALMGGETQPLRLALALLCWTDGQHCGEADQQGAMLAIAELAREAGRPPSGSLRGVGVRTLAGHVVALVALPPARLSALATATDRRLFAAPAAQPGTSSEPATITPSASP